jgi:hypothetical protein
MFLDVARPAITLAPPASGPYAGEVDPVIEAMVNLMPDYSTGARLHALYLNRLQGALPGNYSQMFGDGPAFRGIFYPSWGQDPLTGLVGATGLDDGWWSGFSIAVLCQAIAEMASEIRGQMLTDDINNAVASYNNTLRERSSGVYSQVLAATYPPFTALLQQIDRSTAKQKFHDSLLANVLTRQLWYQAGMWTSPDWEIFNQFAKYLVLGASEGEVDTLIGELMQAGLPVPGNVQQGTWRSYAEELRDKPTLDVNDVRGACADGVNASTYMPSYGMGGMGSYLPNGNCFEFTANSQPGNGFRRPPGGSCFTGATQVLDGDGRAVALADLRRGDTVLTRHGPRAVAYAAQVLRAARPLHRLDAGGPVFTGSHPFFNAATDSATPPRLLALEPTALGLAVPTLTEHGIGRLETGSELFVRAPGGGPTTSARVTSVDHVEATDADDFLYDVHLEPGSGERSEFWVGAGETFYLASPEFPVIEEAGAAAIAVVALMEGLLASRGPHGDGWPPWVVGVVHRFGAGVFLDALKGALSSTPSWGPPPPPAPLDQRIAELYQGLAPGTPETSAVVSTLFDGMLGALGQWLTSLVASGWRTTTLLGGDVVVLTVFDVALRPGNPVPPDALVRLDVTVRGRRTSAARPMWNRRERANTDFHHFYDQLVHLDLRADDRPTDLSFAAWIHGAPVPILFADCPGAVDDTVHALQTAVLRDTSGTIVGDIRFDTRRMGRDAAAAELAWSGTWTDDAARAYANALGQAMVEPVLWKLRQLDPGIIPPA